MRSLRRAMSGCISLQAWASAHACTVCDSPNGQALRAGLFNGHFLHTLLLVMAPVPILLAAAVVSSFFLPDLQPAEPVSDTLAMHAFEAAA